ncbi:hypothetical protein AMECASPLE_023703 [Ameca splendens]|uniref:Uncharacterized protein n=1 Tax=Ameca splendens TaxID=208324 RepID=A0ABV1A2P9_9TELE
MFPPSKKHDITITFSIPARLPKEGEEKDHQMMMGVLRQTAKARRRHHRGRWREEEEAEEEEGGGFGSVEVFEDREGEVYIQTSTFNLDGTNTSLREESYACRGRKSKFN